MKKNKIESDSPPKVSVSSTGKNLTTFAGLLPNINFLSRIGFRKAFASIVTHSRESAVYKLFHAVEQNILGLLAGARSLDMVQHVWTDSVICKLMGIDKGMDATTMSRIFKTCTLKHITQLETLNHVLRSRVWRRCRRFTGKLNRSMWIDCDSTVKTAYGKQEGVEVGYNPHKRGAGSYHPLLAFCTETKEILQGWLRCGSAYTSNGIVEFMQQLCAHIPNKARIIFRADSGFFSGSLMDWLDSRGHGYLIKVKLKNLVSLLERQVWSAIPNKKGWEQTVFFHQCGSWTSARKFIAVRRLKKKQSRQRSALGLLEYDYFCYICTEDMTPWEVHKCYGKRATSETWIEEAKNQIALAHIKTDDFLANSAIFQCSIMAYNSVRWMALISGDKQIRRWEIASVRTYLIRMAGKLTTGSRQLKLATPCDKLYEAHWQNWLAAGEP